MDLKNNFKYFVKEYRNGNIDILNEFIQDRAEIRNDNNHEYLKVTFHFSDAIMNRFMTSCLQRYRTMGEDEVKSIILNTFYDLLDKIDLNRTSGEMLSFVKKRIEFKLRDTYNKYYKNTCSLEQKNQESKDSYDLSDLVVFDEFKILEQESDEKKFLRLFNEKAVNILTRNEFKVYKIIKQMPDITDERLAKKIKMSESNANYLRNNVYEKIRNLFNQYNDYKNNFHTDNTKKIIKMLENYKEIQKFDKGEFDYFNFIIKFLKDNYIKNEQSITYEKLQKNKKENDKTIFDILAENINYKSHVARKLKEILESDYDPINYNNYYIKNGKKKYIKTYEKNSYVKHIIEAVFVNRFFPHILLENSPT